MNGKSFMLAHASHPLFLTTEPILYKDSSKFDKNHILWSRDYENHIPQKAAFKYGRLYKAYGDKILIFGHTPTTFTNYSQKDKNGLPKISRTGNGHLINIDCGAAAKQQLGCLRLDDFTEFYEKI